MRTPARVATVGLPLLLAAGVLLFVLWPVYSGHASFFLFPDAQEQTYAWWQKLASGWQNGYLTLWDANTTGGHSLAGEMQASVYYPFTWLWLVVFSGSQGMPVAALELLVALHFSVAALAMWGLLRHWGMGQTAAVVGALCYALFGPVAERAAAQPNIFYGLCWLPLAVLFASRHVRTGQLRYSVLAGAVIALQVLSGHAQPAFHTALICGVLCFHHHYRQQQRWRDRLRGTFRSGAPMLLAVLVFALPQWLLSLQYLSDAYRWVGSDQPIGPGRAVPYAIFSREHIVAPSQFLALIDPWRVSVDDANTPHLSAFGFALALCAMAVWRSWRLPEQVSPHLPWMSAIALFAVLAMVGHYTPLPYILRKLPLFGQIRELGRYAILLHFIACVSAATALHCLRVGGRPAWGGRGIASAVGVGAVLGIAAAFDALSPPALLSSGLALLAYCLVATAGVPRWLSTVAALVAVVVPAWLYRPMLIPNRGADVAIEEKFAGLPLLDAVEREYGLARIIIDTDAGLPKNYADARPLQSRLGYSATMYRPYYDFLSLDWSEASEVNDLLNMRYVLTRGLRDLPLVRADASGLRLYRRPNAYPRVFEERLFRAPAARRVLPPGFRLLRYDDHVMQFEVALRQSQRLVVSEIAYPGWCAAIDGQAIAIQPAQLGELRTPLRAVRVPAGTHRLRFEYRPFAQMLGLCRPGRATLPGRQALESPQERPEPPKP